MERTKNTDNQRDEYFTTEQLRAFRDLQEIGLTKVTEIEDEVEVEFLVPASQLQKLGVIKITETGLKFLTPSDENLDKLTDLICEIHNWK